MCHFDVQTAHVKRTNENSDWMSQECKKWHIRVASPESGNPESLQTEHCLLCLVEGTLLNNG